MSDITEKTDVPFETAPAGMDRRAMFVTAGAACLAVGGLAACGGGSDTATGAGSSGDTGASATSGSSGASGSSGSAGTSIVSAADVPVGGAVSATLDGKSVIVAMPAADKPVAFDATCPHQGGKVAVQGDHLHCPLHQSNFNLTTGKATSGPAVQTQEGGLTAITVAVKDGEVVTA